MKYVRIVVAVEEEELEEFLDQDLEEFIEENEHIQGAYLTGKYNDRWEAFHGPWKFVK